MTTEDSVTIANVAATSVTITLYHLAWMTKRMPNTCGQLFLLNTYLSAPSRIEELYVLGIMNASSNEVRCDPRFSYNQSNNKWEWF